jgi:hypothetical protein
LKESNDDLEKISKERDDFLDKFNALQDKQEEITEKLNKKDDTAIEYS